MRKSKIDISGILTDNQILTKNESTQGDCFSVNNRHGYAISQGCDGGIRPNKEWFKQGLGDQYPKGEGQDRAEQPEEKPTIHLFLR